MTATTPKQRGGHLYEIDVLRVLTFACVIAVHVIDHSIQPSDSTLFVTLGLFHFTREVFFALTAFVLVYSYGRRPQPMRTFWPRRFLLVGVPYLAWSVVYQGYADLVSPPATVGDALLALLVGVLTGTAVYHLYFLLVTMQVYLLVPAILWLVRRTRAHHLALLVAALVVQLAVLGVYEYVPGLKSSLGSFPNATFTSYVFMIVAGAVAADHATPFLAWLRTGRRTIAVITAGALVLTAAVLTAQIAVGLTLGNAVTALQPIIVVWATAVGLAFLAVGAWWSDRRIAGGALDRAVAAASDISFGVFLVHPLMVYLCIRFGAPVVAALTDPWRQVVLYVAVVISSVAVAVLLRRTPLSLALTGRPMRARTARPVPEPA